MSHVDWSQFPPPFIPKPSKDAKRRLQNPVPIRLTPFRYRSEVALPSVGLIRHVGNEYLADIAPLNHAPTPEELADKLSTDPSTALVALSISKDVFDLHNGTAELNEQLELTVCLFATVQEQQSSLRGFADATIRHHGQDMGLGRIIDLVHEYGHDLPRVPS